MADTLSTHPETGVEQGKDSIEQRMQNALFGKEPEPKQPKAEQPEPTVPAAVEKQPEPVEGAAPTDELTPDDIADDAEPATGDEQPAIEDAFEIVHNGKQVKLNREEVIALARQGFDYTQKTQAVAAKERQVQEALDLSQQVLQMQTALADDLAQVKFFERQLQPYMNADWVALATNDPLEYPKHRAQYDQLMQGYNAATQAYRSKGEQILQNQQKAAQTILSEESKRLGELLPRWQKHEVFQADAKQIADYGLREGYKPDEMNSIRDARMVRTLWKAMRYDQLVAGKSEKVKLMQKAAPMAKPGASTGTPTAADKDKEIRSRLRKSGSDADFAALLLNRMK